MRRWIPRSARSGRTREGGRQRAGPRRAVRSAACLADERHQLARLRLRRHDPAELHPPDVAGRVGALRVRKRQSGERTRLHARVRAWIRGRIARRQRRLSRHYDAGWHITGTAGVSAPRRRSGKLLGLRRAADDLGAWAWRRRRRPACARCSARWPRRFIPGRAAQNGYAAAMLARSRIHGRRARHRRAARLRRGAGGDNTTSPR